MITEQQPNKQQEPLNKPLNIGFLVEIKKDSVINEFGFKSLDYKILNKLRVKNE